MCSELWSDFCSPAVWRAIYRSTLYNSVFKYLCTFVSLSCQVVPMITWSKVERPSSCANLVPETSLSYSSLCSGRKASPFPVSRLPVCINMLQGFLRICKHTNTISFFSSPHMLALAIYCYLQKGHLHMHTEYTNSQSHPVDGLGIESDGSRPRAPSGPRSPSNSAFNFPIRTIVRRAR